MKAERRRTVGVGRWVLALGLLLVLANGGLWWAQKRDRDRPESAPLAPVVPDRSPPVPDRSARALPGDLMLEGYGGASGSAADDLRRVGQVLLNFRLLHKQLDVRFLATNPEMAAALRGEAKGTTPFVSARSPLFNRTGEMQDRWGSPLVVHVLAADRIELRSAGPDRQPWTADDLVRLPNGEVQDPVGGP